MPESPLDVARLHEALALAESSIGSTEPNPRVGCVIGFADGRVSGRGATQPAGSWHAEVMALRDAQASGQSARGATAWVTLEPCAHHGRTPPCCDALIAAGVSRCVVAIADPYPQVAGAGIERMRAAGIQVEMAQDARVVTAAQEMNVGFFSRVLRGRPWLRMKIATSSDGRVALRDGQSKWITGDAARADGHRWRRRASAVLTGIGTALADDPRLDVRALPTLHQPLRIVLDSRLRLPTNAALLLPPGRALVVASSGHAIAADRLRSVGAEVWDDWPEGAMPSLLQLLNRLGQSGHNEIHLEAGPRLNGAMLSADLVDELLLYMAPALLGPGLPMAELPPLRRVADAHRFAWISAEQVGDDMRLRLQRRAKEAMSACVE